MQGKRIYRRLRQFLEDEAGQDVIEYTLLIAFVALGAASIYTSAGLNVASIWTSANNELSSAATAAS